MFEYLNDLKKIIRNTLHELYEEDQSLDEIDNISDADKKQLEEKQKQDELNKKREAEEIARKEKEEKRLADIESRKQADIEKQNQLKADREEKEKQRLADIEKQKEEKSLADIEKQQIKDELDKSKTTDINSKNEKTLDDIESNDKKHNSNNNDDTLEEIESEISGKSVSIPNETKPVVKTNYFSLNEFRQKCKDLGKPSNMKVGYYYVFDYYFDKSKDDIEYSDTMPLCLIYDSDTTKDGKKVFWGFNFHQIDVDTRNKILGEPTDPLHGDNIYPRSKANWDNMINIFPDIKTMVRQYRSDRIKNIRMLSPNVMRELTQYKAPTYYRKSYKDVIANNK